MQELYPILYFMAVALGGVGAWIGANYGYLLGLTDKPNERSSHHCPTPKGGGIGILVTFLLGSLIIEIPPSFWIPAILLALLGFIADKVDFSAKLRLPLQLIGALAFLVGTRRFSMGEINGILILLSAVFVAGTANFYNFMDGINGIAAVAGVIGFGLLSFSQLHSDSGMSYAFLSICIALSCVGFLPFNMPKAKVFMGDVGSILLGFAFAGMVVMLSRTLLDFICLSSLLFPFYADELSTMAIRSKNGENLFRPHRRHLYQILGNEKGIAHWKISTGYGLAQLVVGITVLLLKPFGILIIISLLAAYSGAFIVVSSAVRKNLTASA